MSTKTIRRSRHIWLSPQVWRKRLIFWIGGACAGVAAVAFAVGAEYAQLAFRWLVNIWPQAPLVVTPLGFAISAALTRRLFPGSQGSGIPQSIAARQIRDPERRSRLLSLRIAFGKIVLTLLGLLTGGSVGREGPTVQVGASIMHAVARTWGGRHQGLVVAGGAAGVAAAFNTPLAGIVFAIEEMSRSFEQRASGLVLTAVIIAGLASLTLLGNYTYFGHTAATLTSAGDWPAVVVGGALGGVLGGAFSWILIAVARGLPGPVGRAIRTYPIAYATLCGLAVGLIGLASGGTTYGTGYAEAKRILEGTGDVPQVFGICKMAATILSSISGIPGGIFSPSLAVGAGFGANLAQLLPHTPAGAVVILGMVSYFAGVVQAPITAFVIVMEMTDSNAMIVPLMAAALIASGASRLICPKSVYHALAEGFVGDPRPTITARGAK